MSFSSEVKRELTGRLGSGRHCQLAELAVLTSFLGLSLVSDGSMAGQKFCLLKENLFGRGQEPVQGLPKKVLEAVHMWDHEAGRAALTDTVDGLLIQQSCCKRAYIRGAFLAGGSISDPKKSYHFEIVCKSIRQACQLRDTINSFCMDAKIVERKRYEVVYLKEGEQIVDVLNIMEAHVALMNLENVRIFKEMRNSVNRKVNCETANISKTVNAAVRQLEDIAYIRDKAGLDSLPQNLKEAALLRLAYPDVPLKELGTYLDPPVGKSGVNHRLRKISEIAEALRG